ncbi:hypothetical protein GH714_010464 [Hevea brasiliensis]|uniref:Uncharacterized protein n=1 Tax=Hevea brasiliensis TaxID=3981 RepID=A0A6A6NGJ9_HEVBR|nr:hypothetical protein GH714_010464 [Hevea brasiliensis]
MTFQYPFVDGALFGSPYDHCMWILSIKIGVMLPFKHSISVGKQQRLNLQPCQGGRGTSPLGETTEALSSPSMASRAMPPISQFFLLSWVRSLFLPICTGAQLYSIFHVLTLTISINLKALTELCFLVIGEFGNKWALSRIEGDFACTVEVQRAIPVLKKAYGDSMRKVLHVGPDTCSVKGTVRFADIKFPLPYRPKSFSLVIVSDALDYLSPRYLNKTLPDLARVSIEGLVIFTGFPGQHRAKVAEVSKFGRAAKLRSSTWWARYFIQTSLEENEVALKKFEHAAAKKSYNPGCQVFHLKAYN